MKKHTIQEEDEVYVTLDAFLEMRQLAFDLINLEAKRISKKEKTANFLNIDKKIIDLSNFVTKHYGTIISPVRKEKS